MYKGNIHAPKHAKLIYENATAPVFSLISNGGFSWNLNVHVKIRKTGTKSRILKIKTFLKSAD